MPETQTDTHQSEDVGKELAVDMVKNLAVLTSTNELLIQKLEDLTAAMDDMRESTDGFREDTTALTGYVEGILTFLEKMGLRALEAEDEEEGEALTWRDVGEVVKGMKKEADAEGEDEESEESEE